MNMSFDQYIVNPMGVKNAVYSNKEMYRQLYTDKLDKVLVREVGKVNFTLYIDKENDTYYVHMKVPSEVIEKFYYDVVIQLYTDDSTVATQRSLKDYYVKFYSNDPSFVFTFAHAMLENDLFIRDLVPRMSKEAVQKVASERNPKNEIGYVKSLYFTYLLMKNYGLFNKIVYESQAQKYDKKKLLKEIVHANDKIKSRQEAQIEYDKKKKIDKQKEKVGSTVQAVRQTVSHPTTMVHTINKVAKTGVVKGVNTIKKSTKIKKI